MIDLPENPSPNGADIGVQDFGLFLTPGLGGPVQRINRLGDRFRGSFTMPPMPQKQARPWVARLIRGKREGVRMAYPLLDFDPGAPGTVLINGAAQTGSSLIVDGATPYYAFREGQVFSILTGAKHHIYMVATETIANATGQATLPLTTLLRRPHADNDVCHFAQPMIEGFVMGDEIGWQISVDKLFGIQFDIAESQ
jgi:hypothetical protein